MNVVAPWRNHGKKEQGQSRGKHETAEAPEKIVHGGAPRWLKIAALCLALLIPVAAVVLAAKWPFTRAAVIKSLEREAHGKVEFRNFRGLFFPRAGCVIEGLVIHQPDSSLPPLIRAERVEVTADYLGLLHHDLATLRADNMRLRIPPKRERRDVPESGGGSKMSNLAIGHAVGRNVTLEFPSEDPHKEPFVIAIHDIELSGAAKDRQFAYRAALHIPEPPGEVTTQGQFGPWATSDPFHTPVRGSYTFERANLGKFEGVAGILWSQAQYQGTLEALDVQGTVEIPDFQLRSAGHPVALKTRFHAKVNGRNGDTRLQDVASTFQRTTIVTTGAVADEGHVLGKTVAVDMAVTRGRIEDVLYLILKDSTPGMTGDVTLRTKAWVPPEDRKFLEKVKLNGEFNIARGHFTSENTQQSVNKLSAQGQGEKHGESLADAISDASGAVVMDGGVARFSRLSFRVPGALADVQGTYNVISKRLNFHGTLHLDVKVSETKGGVKHVFLKLLDPLFKNKHGQGSHVPVKIGGTFDHPQFAVDWK